MDNQSVKNNDPIQLQQMIIFLRAELAKYKNEINRLRDSDYYSLVLRLERENVQLTRRNKELSMDRIKLKRTVERDARAYDEELQRREIQRKKHISSIDALLKEIEHLRFDNKRLQQTRDAANAELLSIKGDYIAADDKRAIESLEIQFSTFTKEMYGKMGTIIEALQRNEADNVHDYLAKELAEKDNEINRLSAALADVKNKNMNATAFNDKTTANAKILSHIDSKIQKIIAQSTDFEQQLVQKVRILDDLEQQLTQLTLEINAIDLNKNSEAKN